MTLTEARKRKGWSQARLASELGLRSKGHVCDIEREKVAPSLSVAVGLYRHLGVKVGPLEGLTDREVSVLEKTVAARAA